MRKRKGSKAAEMEMLLSLFILETYVRLWYNHVYEKE